MNSDEFYEYEDRAYLKPTLSSGEQEAFINNLRDIQSQNNQQIATDTYNLGTAVPSNLGGLGGGETYFDSRYQTPQVNDMVATLKSAAQAQALNDVMSNYQSQLKQRYNSAYRRAQKRARAAAGGGNNGGNNGGTDPKGKIRTEDTGVRYNKKLINAFSDERSPYNMTSYIYTPTGEVITEYQNPQTGNTYKYAGDKLRFINGKAAGLVGGVYDFVYKQLGRFPNDN